MTCMKIAIRLARPTTQSRPYLNCAPRLQIGAPVAGIHVADADQNGRADERPPVLPEASLVVGHLDGAVHTLERGVMTDFRSSAAGSAGLSSFPGFMLMAGESRWPSVLSQEPQNRKTSVHYWIVSYS